MTPHGAAGSLAERSAQGVIELSVTELEPSLAFYARLGFSLERRHGGFASLTGHGCRLFLSEDAHAAALPLRQCNLRIIVDDVQAVREMAEKAGAPISRELADRGYGMRDFSVLDPTGFGLRFAQSLS